MASRADRKPEALAAARQGARRRERARALLIGAIVAAIIGFGAGLLVRMWSDSSPEERARDTVGELRERARELAH
ncbi:hypothetical protein [Anaeromyxobacter terrae]|uniref:hypothetical protein n=1 Tax=Anaeromyxobacter terrae TaxID=2925406 RepID=UPI001F568C01|nr:hypothetical protein [Anaeromyxobacter sp. SG22]